ncbi:NAD(P)H:quinone oxidoreductase, type IV [Phytophthora cinnamomi]|uniref:NAD(P)H:quinone oxidoreductase, type IV n=1 Tax=Phytophthora cinnamomi TaxID=4785 RepID=UPI003559A653|nr:NAD(P)H:quinone oxidoreductase, type IV [Phytophthora cinnamomi]
MTNVAIVYYSMYGHVAKLASSIKAGVTSVPGVKASVYQVQETLNDDLLKALHAPAKPDLPIATPDVLKNADGILLGFPTRFGMLPSQVKGLFDACGGLWARGELIGKPCGIFFSSASLGAGQETTAMSMTPFIAHHGMTFVPLGYRSPLVGTNEEIHGGSPWGAGTLANADGSRQPTDIELEIAKIQGQSFAEITKKLSS